MVREREAEIYFLLGAESDRHDVGHATNKQICRSKGTWKFFT